MTKFVCMMMLLSTLAMPQVMLGPFTGAVTGSTAQFLVKTYTPQEVKIELFSEDDPETALYSAPVFTDTIYHYAKIKAGSLRPDTRYFYRAIVNGIASKRWHQFQTFPSADNVNFSFGFGSCQQSGYSPWNPEVFPAAAQDTLRFFIQIGDWTYPDTTERKYGYRFNSSMDLLEKSYRSKYDYNYPFASEVMSQMPVMYVYDDHDYAANNPDGTDANKEKTLDAYKMFFPHYPLANESSGIWQSFRFGNTEFFMLDLRSQRNKNSAAFDQNGNFAPPENHSILAGLDIDGENQKDWLIRQLVNSGAKWKVIVSSVIFNPSYGKVFDNPQLLEKYPWMKDDAADKWSGFPADFKTIMKVVKENNIRNVIVVSGDTHSSYIDDGTNSFFPEISASNLDVNNTYLNSKLKEGGLEIWNRGSYEGELHTYGRVSFINNADIPYALLELVDSRGNVVLSYRLDSEE